MFKKYKKLILFCAVYITVAVFLLTTCGIETYYYLPQVRDIATSFNSSATINLPSLSAYYYAQNYSIYYKIYISSEQFGTKDNLSLISTTLAADFNAIYPNTDPTGTTMGTPADTLFKGRGYYKPANVSNLLPIIGGNVEILFPSAAGGIPVISVSGIEFNLYRSGELISPKPFNRYFQSTPELRAPENVNSNENADVVPSTGGLNAYVSMYIVAVGTDTAKFTPIYGKPTHISVFKLPDNN